MAIRKPPRQVPDPVCSCPGEGRSGGGSPASQPPPPPSLLGMSSGRAPLPVTQPGAGGQVSGQPSSTAQGPRGSPTRPQPPLRSLSPTGELSPPPFLLLRIQVGRGMLQPGTFSEAQRCGASKGLLSWTPALRPPTPATTPAELPGTPEPRFSTCQRDSGPQPRVYWGTWGDLGETGGDVGKA